MANQVQTIDSIIDCLSSVAISLWLPEGSFFFAFCGLKEGGRTSICRELPGMLGQSRGGDSKLFCREVFPFISALEVGNKNEIKTRLQAPK
jgi:hypothetical protein